MRAERISGAAGAVERQPARAAYVRRLSGYLIGFLCLLNSSAWAVGGVQAAAAPAPDSVRAWLQRGCAAQARFDRPTAFAAFGRAAAAPGLAGWSARLAQSRILLALGAPTAASAKLDALRAAKRQREPWAEVAWQLTLAAHAQAKLDPMLALDKARRADQLMRQLTRANDPHRIQSWMALAAAHTLNGRPDSAVLYATQAVKLARRANQNAAAEPLWLQAALPPVQAEQLYGLLASALSSLGKEREESQRIVVEGRRFQSMFAASEAYFDSAIRAAGKAPQMDSSRVAALWRNRAVNWKFFIDEDTLAETDAYLPTLQHLDRAIALERRANELAITWVVRGELRRELIGPEAALADFQQALATLVPGADLADPTSLPPALKAAAEQEAVRYLLEQKAAYFREKYRRNHQKRDLEAYCLHAQRLAEILAYRRRQASLGKEPEAAAVITRNLRDNYALAVEATEAQYRAYQRPVDLEEAFRITENAKAWRLLTRIGGERPTEALRTDQRLLREYEHRTTEQRRRQEILAVLRQYPHLSQVLELQHATDSAALSDRRVVALIGRLRAKYPTLYTRAFDGDYAISLREAQANLPADGSTAAVEFLRRTAFEDGSHQELLYAFVVQRTGTRLLRMKLAPNFSATVENLAQALARSDKNAAYPALAAEIYAQVMAPVQQVLAPGVTRLVLAPDGELWRVPFEALLTKAPDAAIAANATNVANAPGGAPIAYRKLPYLLRTWSVTYAHSLTLRANAKAESAGQPTEARTLAMAPFSDRDDPQALPFSGRLLGQLADLIGGEFLTGARASTANFRAKADQFQILHLATHAAPDMADPRASRVLMADRPLTLAELFGLRLRPQMVVLSACETGVGKMTESSEGLTSLSWGFTFAGAASTVATLWRVDDRATANLLADFYGGLHDGLPKDIALNKAKQKAIDSAGTDLDAAPFNWSGMVLTGDERPIRLAPPARPMWLWVAGGALVALGVLGGWWWQRKKLINN